MNDKNESEDINPHEDGYGFSAAHKEACKAAKKAKTKKVKAPKKTLSPQEVVKKAVAKLHARAERKNERIRKGYGI